MRVLVIGAFDDKVSFAAQVAKERGASVTHVPTIDAALSDLRVGRGADLVMIDVREDVEKLTRSLHQEHIHVEVVAYGLNAKSEEAVRAIKAGAKEFIPFPPERDLIIAMLEAISDSSNTLIYQSNAMKRIIDVANKVAPSDASILITGESGTGKEVMARYIHTGSKRKDAPFISVNCAAIPEQLLESELFGHEKGAFTGAVAQRIGKFEEANTGTLLLDEISEMDLRLQAKLLRAIQEREIDRVGGTKPVKLNIRVIATSNRDLKKEVETGKFREDLWFRLNVINLQLPPLRDRKEDIPRFVEYFIKKYAKNNGMDVNGITDAALKKLIGYSWPGNVRELENTVHRAVLLANGTQVDEDAILFSANDDVPEESAGLQTLVGRTVDSVERELILSTLAHCLGNRTHAANILGISIRTLRNKLKEYESGSDSQASAG